MGALLSAPVIDKIVEDGNHSSLVYGAATMQGWRKKQEDAYSCLATFDTSSAIALFAVYDGHGGPEVAQYCASRLPEAIRLTAAYVAGNLERALSQAFADIDDGLKDAATLAVLRELAAKAEAERVTSGRPSAGLPSIKEEVRPKGARRGGGAAYASLTDCEKDESVAEDDGDWGFGYCRNGGFVDDDETTATVNYPLADSYRRSPRLGAQLRESDDASGRQTASSVERVPGVDSGSTACVVLIRAGTNLYVANAGDSRCVLCQGGLAVDLSRDHRPADQSESDRIVRAGGHVTQVCNRINGRLNVSRSIGDHAYKRAAHLPREEQMVVATPDVVRRSISPGDRFVVVASAGVWNCRTSQWVVDFVSHRLSSQKPPKLSCICAELLDALVSSDPRRSDIGTDNMTCIIVAFGDSDGQSARAAFVEDGADDRQCERPGSQETRLARVAVSASPPSDQVPRQSRGRENRRASMPFLRTGTHRSSAASDGTTDK